MNGAGIDKEKLLQEVIAQVKETLRRLRSGYAVAKQATLDSPHVMKSKREVTGIEASYLANALAGNMQEREFSLRTLRRMRLPETPQRVALGCVVGSAHPTVRSRRSTSSSLSVEAWRSR